MLIIDTAKIAKRLQSVLDASAAETFAEVLADLLQQVYDQTISQRLEAALNELAEIRAILRRSAENWEQTQQAVRELAERQSQTEAAIQRLTATTERLEQEQAEFRKQTEQRFASLLEELRTMREQTEAQIQVMREELAEQRRHFDEQLAEQRRYTDEQFELLRAELAEQRRRSDEQFDLLRAELAEQRRRSDEQFDLLRAELAEQRQRSDEQFDLLRAELAEQRRHTDAQFEQLRQQLGGLSMTVGYALEDLAYYYLPELLQRDHGIEVVEGLTRTFVQDQKGYYVEVNIWGEARQDGRTLQIIGEAKSQLSKRTIDQFIKARVERLGKLYPNLFPVMVAFMVSEPDVFEYARRKGVTIYLSYQFQPRSHPLLPST